MGAPTVVFDLDGTLVDSAPDLVATLNTVFAQEGLPPVPYYTARNLVGGGARSMSDIATARAAGVPIVAVDYGYTEIPVAEMEPDQVISALTELPSAIFGLLRAGSPTLAEQR